ncbi:uncharacterized protein LOC116294915 [Actinia tenebrosa]|uniref:Uncharacterized protein LOC116294915 n=1 Tax=Actinia tenebrosa TaxID=6105 RepID=A0A6P8HTA9_ACTTE|nr:uncharacterized protein LOC116294915 [Actinia tenebrosa]
MGCLCPGHKAQVTHTYFLFTNNDIVRLANLSDAGSIYRIHTSAIREICSKCYKEEEVEHWIERQSENRYVDFIEKGDILVAEDGEGRVLGFGHLSDNEEECSRGNSTTDMKQDGWKFGVIRALYVHPDHVKQKVGQTLLKCMEDKTKEKHAKELVVYSTVNAISFYERFGFRLVGKTKQCGQGVNLQCTKLLKKIA